MGNNLRGFHIIGRGYLANSPQTTYFEYPEISILRNSVAESVSLKRIKMIISRYEESPNSNERLYLICFLVEESYYFLLKKLMASFINKRDCFMDNLINV